MGSSWMTSKLTPSSGITEKIKLCPSGSLLGLSWLGHICSKGNEQAGLLLLFGMGANEDFDARLDELSPPESELNPDCCFGDRHIFFRRDDVESRLFSGFYGGKARH